jgi:hypothetical protein
MRTWIVVVAVVAVGVLAFAIPTLSQEATRIGAVLDVAVLTKRLDALTKQVEELKKQNAEMQKSVDEAQKALVEVAVQLKTQSLPQRYEYRIRRTPAERLLNAQGKDGWELVLYHEKDEMYYFRRPLPPPAPAPGPAAGPGGED